MAIPTAGYSGKSLIQKFGIKENQSILLLRAPENFMDLISPLPEKIKLTASRWPLRTAPPGQPDMIICFVQNEKDYEGMLPGLKTILAAGGMIWMCWAKKSSPLFSGITEDAIRNIALRTGLVDIKVCAVDENYSGLKLVMRKK